MSFFSTASIGIEKNLMLMITDDACPYCQAWEFELGDIYPKTVEGKKFPILRIPIDAPLASYSLNSAPAVGTPTFIFVQNKNEIGRIGNSVNPKP